MKAILDSIFDVASAELSRATGWSQAAVSGIADEYVAPAIISGLVVWLIWRAFLWVQKPNIAASPPPQVQRADNAVLDGRTSMSPGGTDEEMTLGQLFVHVDGDVWENVALRDRVGREIADKCSLGRIRAWGRTIIDSKRSALLEIPSEDWRDVAFTYWFLDHSDGQSLDMECRVPRSGTVPRQYADVRVSHADVLKAWPTPSPMPLRDAARQLYEQVQDTVIARFAEREGKTSDGILEWFASHLLLHSPVRAQRVPSTRFIEIPEDEKTQLSVFDGGNAIRNFTEGKAAKYVSPYIKREELSKSLGFLQTMSEPFKC